MIKIMRGSGMLDDRRPSLFLKCLLILALFLVAEEEQLKAAAGRRKEEAAGGNKGPIGSDRQVQVSARKLLQEQEPGDDQGGGGGGGGDDQGSGEAGGDDQGGGGGGGGDDQGGGGGDKNRIGGECSKDDVVIYQGQTDPLPDGVPTYTVQILNVCVSDCSISDIHVSCGWFSSTRLVNPRVFRRIYYDDCLVNDGDALGPGQSLSFQYANSFSYPLSVSTVSC